MQLMIAKNSSETTDFAQKGTKDVDIQERFFFGCFIIGVLICSMFM